MINNDMSNIILPLNTVDFSASIAEVSPYLENQLLEIVTRAWSTAHVVLAEASEMPVTTELLSSLNISLLNLVYLEVQGGTEKHYNAARTNSSIIVPLEETGSTFSAYSAPIDSERKSDPITEYYEEDCTLLESHSLDEPIFVGSELDGAELVYAFDVPEGQLFKAILIFINENTIPQ